MARAGAFQWVFRLMSIQCISCGSAYIWSLVCRTLRLSCKLHYRYAPYSYFQILVESFSVDSMFSGLLVQGVGAILFWPFWHIHSFPGLCIANFVAGSSTALLENAVLPYIAGCGPSYRQEMRVMISGGLHSVASILATVTAGYIFYGGAGTVKHSGTSRSRLRPSSTHTNKSSCGSGRGNNQKDQVDLPGGRLLHFLTSSSILLRNGP